MIKRYLYKYNNICNILLGWRASLDVTVRLFHWDLEVTDSNYGNKFVTCEDKHAYIDLPRPCSGGSLVHCTSLFILLRC